MEAKSARSVLRKLLKKNQRKRRRQAAAKARDEKAAEEEAARLKNPEYQQFLLQQEAIELCQRQQEEIRRQEEENAWLLRERIAQEQFRLDKQRQEEEKNLQQIEEKGAKEKDLNDIRKKQSKANAEFEDIMKQMEEFLNDTTMRKPPDSLNKFLESRPNAKICEFYEKTNFCRYGFTCGFNHRRPLISRIILIHHFFSHPALKELNENLPEEDSFLENTELDLRKDYDDFFYDIVPEMEKFGRIINLRCIRNVQKHLRGHVFVEFEDERSAIKAFTNLHGRYYASKKLNVEFSHLKTWRGAVCGLSFSRRCPKTFNCNYLHLFKNPLNKYNLPLENTKNGNCPSSEQRRISSTPLLSWNDVNDCKERNRDWRWSESPEMELNYKPSKSHKTNEHKDARSSRKSHDVYNGPSKHRSRSSKDDRPKSKKKKKSKSKSPSRKRKHGSPSRSKKHKKNKDA